ncbi:MAG: hypothetical protein ACRCVJ_12015 [Clostridium sp.]|uniref:hypothetical protein n=1 Tax=Clostridium sp. TaxID=1506 RepID=UPI003F307701
MNLRFCYRVEKEAGLAEDMQGNKAEVYSCSKHETEKYNIPKEEYIRLSDIYREINSSFWGVDLNLVTPITLNEYLDNTEDDE